MGTAETWLWWGLEGAPRSEHTPEGSRPRREGLCGGVVMSILLSPPGWFWQPSQAAAPSPVAMATGRLQAGRVPAAVRAPAAARLVRRAQRSAACPAVPGGASPLPRAPPAPAAGPGKRQPLTGGFSRNSREGTAESQVPPWGWSYVGAGEAGGASGDGDAWVASGDGERESGGMLWQDQAV